MHFFKGLQSVETSHKFLFSVKPCKTNIESGDIFMASAEIGEDQRTIQYADYASCM